MGLVQKRVTLDVIQDGKRVDTIKRIPLTYGFSGNFIPHWVRYRKEIYMIKGGIDYEYMHGPNPEGTKYYIKI